MTGRDGTAEEGTARRPVHVFSAGSCAFIWYVDLVDFFGDEEGWHSRGGTDCRPVHEFRVAHVRYTRYLLWYLDLETLVLIVSIYFTCSYLACRRAHHPDYTPIKYTDVMCDIGLHSSRWLTTAEQTIWSKNFWNM